MAETTIILPTKAKLTTLNGLIIKDKYLISGAAFDLDGTIADSTWVQDATVGELYKHFKIQPQGNDLKEFAAFRAERKLGGDLIAAFAQFVYEKYSPKDISAEDITMEGAKTYCGLIRDKVTLKPGALGLLQYLQSKDVPMALATSINGGIKKYYEANEDFKRNKIFGMFKAVYTNDDVANGKPHREMYDKAVDAIGTPRETTFAFEDTVGGAQAAISAGLKLVAVKDPKSAKDEQKLLSMTPYYLENLGEIER